MIETNPSDPSDEGKPRVADAPIQWTDGSGTWFKLFTRTWTERDQRRTDPVAATPADLLAAGYVPLSQPTEARDTVKQFQASADALESFANGDDVGARCAASHPGEVGLYHCRTEEPCLACRVRVRFAKAEAQLTEARAELERALAAAARRIGELEGAIADVADGFEQQGKRGIAAQLRQFLQPSPPAAVEAKPAELHIQTSPFRQVAEASAKPAEGSGAERCPQCNKAANPPSGFRCAHPWHDAAPAQEQPASPKLGVACEGSRQELIALFRDVHFADSPFRELADRLERGGK